MTYSMLLSKYEREHISGRNDAGHGNAVQSSLKRTYVKGDTSRREANGGMHP
jgi:hypothetical protein